MGAGFSLHYAFRLRHCWYDSGGGFWSVICGY